MLKILSFFYLSNINITYNFYKFYYITFLNIFILANYFTLLLEFFFFIVFIFFFCEFISLRLED